MRRHVLLMALAALTSATAAHAQTRSPKVFVLDQGAPSVTEVDLKSGTAVHTAPLEGSPSILLRTHDGTGVLAFDRGTGKDAGDAGFQAKTKSSVTILDADTLASKGRVELGAGLEDTVMLGSAGDRLAVICPGYVGRRPEENQPRELVTVDLESGQVTGRVPLARPASAFFSTPDGKTAIVLAFRGKPKQTPPLPAELQLIDLKTAKMVATITFDGDPRDPVLSPDGKYVYLLDRGDPSGNPEKNVNGRVHVIAVDARKVDAVHDVGSNPRGLVLDEVGKQMLLVSDGAPVKGQSDRAGELRALRGAAVVGPVATLASPQFIRATADGKRLFVVSRPGVTTYNARDLTAVGELRDRNVNGDDFTISPDGRRAFSIWQQNLYTFDLENGKQIEKVVTGRMGSRIAAALGAAAATQNSKNDAKRDASRKGQSYYSYTEYTVRDPSQTIAVRPDSKAVYVVNRQTSDVTVVDAESGQVIEKVGADGSRVSFLPAAGIALVIDDTAVHAVDLATNKKGDDLATGKGYSFGAPQISADGKYAVISAGTGVLLIDSGSGKASARLLPFKRVVDMEIDW
jgi:DNA-binding beta-propeller fold protein YncE